MPSRKQATRKRKPKTVEETEREQYLRAEAERKAEDGPLYQERAELYAKILAHPNCSQAFRIAFDALYVDVMLKSVRWSHPDLVRDTFAPLRLWLDGDDPVMADAADEGIMLLHERLNPPEVNADARK